MSVLLRFSVSPQGGVNVSALTSSVDGTLYLEPLSGKKNVIFKQTVRNVG